MSAPLDGRKRVIEFRKRNLTRVMRKSRQAAWKRRLLRTGTTIATCERVGFVPRDRDNLNWIAPFWRLREPLFVSQFRRYGPDGAVPCRSNSHLNELVRRHQAIEEAILAEESHPASDDIKVHELKRKKLHLKDEIERLKHRAETTASH